jgi:hypothetical protein
MTYGGCVFIHYFFGAAHFSADYSTLGDYVKVSLYSAKSTFPATGTLIEPTHCHNIGYGGIHLLDSSVYVETMMWRGILSFRGYRT